MTTERHPRFMTVEGGDGVGKTTQVRLLCEFLSEAGVAYTLVREPGGTSVGESVRNLLLDPSHAIEVATEALLYAASRAEVVHRVIRPALAAGEVVICDRYVDSSLAYQGIAGGLGLDAVRQINAIATGGLLPSLTVLLDLPVEAARQRRTGSADRMESKGEAFMAHVRQAYRELAQAEPQRFRVVAAGGSVDAVQAEVRTIVAGWLWPGGQGEGTS